MRLNKPGQALVEFALVLPILLLLFATIIDGAMIVQGYLAANHAAREAARFAVTYQPVQGQCLGAEGQSWPMWAGGGSEREEDYYERRVAVMKPGAVPLEELPLSCAESAHARANPVPAIGRLPASH